MHGSSKEAQTGRCKISAETVAAYSRQYNITDRDWRRPVGTSDWRLQSPGNPFGTNQPRCTQYEKASRSAIAITSGMPEHSVNGGKLYAVYNMRGARTGERRNWRVPRICRGGRPCRRGRSSWIAQNSKRLRRLYSIRNFTWRRLPSSFPRRWLIRLQA
jgi:hypothetical protein